MPQLASQPAVAEAARAPQLQPAQPHLHAVERVGRQFPIVGEQAQAGVALLLLVEHIERLAPGRLLLVVDLTQVEHGTLHGPAARYATVLDDAEIAVVLAVLPTVGAAQKHRKHRMS
jgi:hypothetical protein